jgi:excinuclease ABC subunit C
MMREVLMRRLRRGLEEGDLPQLLVVDGGRGQLGVAVAVVEDLKIEGLDVVGLAKSRVLDGDRDDLGAPARSPERVFLPGRKDPVALRSNTDELHLMTYLRDEAHRFANSFHRQVRDKKVLRSTLEEIPGVGPARRRALLKTFGSLKRVREATLEALAAVPGIGDSLARDISRHLGNDSTDAYDAPP